MLLLIDSNDLFRSALATNLRDDGYHVQENASLQAVRLDDLSQQPVEALLIDCTLDRENGLRFVHRFHQSFPTVPVIIIMADGERLRDRVADLEYVNLLPKPLDYELLASTLRAAR